MKDNIQETCVIMFMFMVRVCKVGLNGMVVLFYRDKRGSRVVGMV